MILVVAAVIVDDLTDPSRVLAARRTGPANLAGGWEFPGGKVEPGEDPTAALHRELAEELQITVDLGAELCPPEGRAWPIVLGHEMRLWFAAVASGTPTSTDSHDELRWLPADQLDQVDWLPADRAIIVELSNRLRMVRPVRERGIARRQAEEERVDDGPASGASYGYRRRRATTKSAG